MVQETLPAGAKAPNSSPTLRRTWFKVVGEATAGLIPLRRRCVDVSGPFGPCAVGDRLGRAPSGHPWRGQPDNSPGEPAFWRATALTPLSPVPGLQESRNPFRDSCERWREPAGSLESLPGRRQPSASGNLRAESTQPVAPGYEAACLQPERVRGNLRVPSSHCPGAAREDPGRSTGGSLPLEVEECLGHGQHHRGGDRDVLLKVRIPDLGHVDG